MGGVCFQGTSGINPLSQGIRPASSPEGGALGSEEKSELDEEAAENQNEVEGKDGEEKCVGETIMVLYDTKKGETVDFTPEWRAMIEDFEKRKL